VVGEQSFLDHQPRSTSIRALTEGEVFRLSREKFLVFSAREPALARDLLLDLGRIVSLRLRDTTRFLAQGR
jgi:CRP/FNR family cyclic AMP-dependent transcriptional regulator